MGIDIQLLAGLGIFHDNRADIRQLHLARVPQAHRQHFVALVEQAQRPLPAGRADEIGDDKHQRAFFDGIQAAIEQRRQVGEGRARQARLLEQVVDQAQHLHAPAAGRDGALDAAAVEHGAHAVAVPGEQARQGGDEIDQHAAFNAGSRAEIDRRAEVEQKPGGDLAVFDVLAHIRRVHARGDIPVDVADIIFRLVFAQVGKIDPVAVEQAAVVALQQAIQAADDLPVQALQDALRRWRGRWHVHAAAPPGSECGRGFFAAGRRW